MGDDYSNHRNYNYCFFFSLIFCKWNFGFYWNNNWNCDNFLWQEQEV